MQYLPEDLIYLAKRYQNAKRNYLLVNPLQAKHLGAEPCQALDMMQTLGKQLFSRYPEAKLLIGFAETATAIATQAAMQFPEDVQFVHTTREKQEGKVLQFLEEHSHAVQQRLNLEGELPETKEIILIDDEISTGKTIQNMITQIRKEIPAYQKAKFIAGSLINRVPEENLLFMQKENIVFEWLCKPENTDYSRKVEQMEVHAPEELPFGETKPYACILSRSRLPESRKLHTVGEYRKTYREFVKTVRKELENRIAGKKRLLILGTEECMYPAILLGAQLSGQGFDVKCHATTRSPIGISLQEGYPIQEGYALPSFYDVNRKTYLYQPDRTAEVVLIVTDSHADTEPAMQKISMLFPESEKILIKG